MIQYRKKDDGITDPLPPSSNGFEAPMFRRKNPPDDDILILTANGESLKPQMLGIEKRGVKHQGGIPKHCRSPRPWKEICIYIYECSNIVDDLIHLTLLRGQTSYLPVKLGSLLFRTDFIDILLVGMAAGFPIRLNSMKIRSSVKFLTSDQTCLHPISQMMDGM